MIDRLDAPRHSRASSRMIGRAVECPCCGLGGQVWEWPDGTQGVMHAQYDDPLRRDAYCVVWWLTADKNPCIELGRD